MEYLDIYDEQGNHIGIEERGIVHKNALWHKTVHCWLYDKEGNIYFQIRQEEKTFYTTASGHLSAGESVKQGFSREIKEEIGIEIDAENAKLVNIIPFIMDRENKDKTFFRDRAFSNVYVCEFLGNSTDFNYDHNELAGLVKVNAKETIALFEKGSGSIPAEIITQENKVTSIEKRNVDFQEFLVNKHETAIKKYGDILKKVIELTN